MILWTRNHPFELGAKLDTIAEFDALELISSDEIVVLSPEQQIAVTGLVARYTGWGTSVATETETALSELGNSAPDIKGQTWNAAMGVLGAKLEGLVLGFAEYGNNTRHLVWKDLEGQHASCFAEQ